MVKLGEEEQKRLDWFKHQEKIAFLELKLEQMSRKVEQTKNLIDCFDQRVRRLEQRR